MSYIYIYDNEKTQFIYSLLRGARQIPNIQTNVSFYYSSKRIINNGHLFFPVRAKQISNVQTNRDFPPNDIYTNLRGQTACPKYKQIMIRRDLYLL